MADRGCEQCERSGVVLVECVVCEGTGATVRVEFVVDDAGESREEQIPETCGYCEQGRAKASCPKCDGKGYWFDPAWPAAPRGQGPYA